MKVKVYMSRKDEIYEKKSLEYVSKKFSKSVESILEKMESLAKSRDIKGIFQYFSKEIDRKAYYLLSQEWMKQEEALVEKIGFVFKLPGLKKDEERYTIYVLMAYSKGFVIAPSSVHHPGDLERIIILSYPSQKGKRAYYSFNTAAHGYPALFKYYLGVYDSLEKALENYSFYFKPGDHAVGLIKNKELKAYSELKRTVYSFLSKSKTLTNLYQTAKNFFRKLGAEEETREPYTFYLIKPQEFKDNLDIDFEGYLERVVYLDSILTKLKRKSKDSKQKSLISKLEKILWRTPIEKVPDEIKSLYKKCESTKLFDSQVLQKMREIQLYVNEILKKVSDLRRDSFYDPEEYLQRKGVQKFSELSLGCKLEIPLGLEMLLRKPLYDWGYPEKSSLISKAGRAFFSVADVFYRAFQKITIIMSK